MKQIAISILLFLLLLTSCGKDEAGQVIKKSDPEPVPAHVKQARIDQVTRWYEAVGTVKPAVESFISAQITAEILEITVRPGQVFRKGDTLVRLDRRVLQARLSRARDGLTRAKSMESQARQSILAATAIFEQSKSEYRRTQTFYESEATTKSLLEQAEARYLKAKADLSRSREALKAARAGVGDAENMLRETVISAGHAELKAHSDGEVLRRLAEPGNLALPGKPLLAVKTDSSMIIEAFVREGMISAIKIGAPYKIHVPPIGKTYDGTIQEIVPYADPQTRTFLVKASLPEDPDLYAGMFGKLLLPMEKEEIVSIPEKALILIGQLELVMVKNGDRWEKRFIKAGRKTGDRVEVLSGLQGTETIGY